MKINQTFSTHVTLPSLAKRRSVVHLIQNTTPKTIHAAMQRLDQKFGFTATANNRNKLLHAIDGSTQDAQRFDTWWTQLEDAVTSYRSLGGYLDEEMLLNKMQRLSSPSSSSSRLSWKQRIEMIRPIYKDDLPQIVMQLEEMQAQDDEEDRQHRKRYQSYKYKKAYKTTKEAHETAQKELDELRTGRRRKRRSHSRRRTNTISLSERP